MPGSCFAATNAGLMYRSCQLRHVEPGTAICRSEAKRAVEGTESWRIENRVSSIVRAKCCVPAVNLQSHITSLQAGGFQKALLSTMETTEHFDNSANPNSRFHPSQCSPRSHPRLITGSKAAAKTVPMQLSACPSSVEGHVAKDVEFGANVGSGEIRLHCRRRLPGGCIVVKHVNAFPESAPCTSWRLSI